MGDGGRGGVNVALNCLHAGLQAGRVARVVVDSGWPIARRVTIRCIIFKKYWVRKTTEQVISHRKLRGL